MAGYDHYLVIDFEASGVVQQSSEWEIVEFPIVVVDAHALKRVPDEFHQYVRPTVNPKLSDQCIQSCGIAQSDVEGASPIDVVVAEAIAWVESLNVGDKIAVVTCGDYDLKTALRIESQRKGFLLPDWLRRWVNIKVPFARIYGRETGMKGMLSQLNLSLDGRHHCGLDDAMNIAKILIDLLKSGITLDITNSYELEGVPSACTSQVQIAQTAARRWNNASSTSDVKRGRWRTSPSERETVCPQGGKDISHHEVLKQSKSRSRTPNVRIDEPWLSWLVSGVKTHEGRLCRGMWAKLLPGDRLIAYSAKFSHVDLEVKDILRFDDFDDAFASLGRKLVPEGATTPAEALQLYRRWNTAEAVRECGGVVAVAVSVGEVHLCAT
jgi:inhibitor of KinA sporulation pathway (predicted exonuclease)/ASC-1-like (ASCH) protein